MTDYKDLENIKYLKKDDTFRFGCDCCGKCCRNRSDILLNAYDIIRLQKFLGISFVDLLHTYCELYIGENSRLPLVRLRTDKSCPFLIHNKCSVQSAKPTVCALFPLGRVYDGKEIRYFLQDCDCYTEPKEHLLHEWIESLGPENEKCCVLWSDMLNAAVTVIKQGEGIAMEEIFMEMLIFLMYDEYEIEKDLASQMQERISSITGLLDTLSFLYKKGDSKRT